MTTSHPKSLVLRQSRLSACVLPALLLAAAASASPDRSPQALVETGHRYYYQGALGKAADAYAQAPAALEARLNGAVVLEELGKPAKAVEWYRKAAELSPDDPKILTALGWAELRNKEVLSAEKHLRAALGLSPRELYALIGLGRVELSAKRPREAAQDFQRATELDPLNNLALYLLGTARESAGDAPGAAEAYRKAAANDSYFIEARYALGRLYLRTDRYREAAVQFDKVLDADPNNGPLRSLRKRSHALIGAGAPPKPERRSDASRKMKPHIEILMPPSGDTPVLRVGIGTSALGRPLPRRALGFQCSTPFAVIDAKTGRPLARGEARETWRVRLTPRKKSWRFEVIGPEGRLAVSRQGALRIKPDPRRGGTILLHDIPYARGHHWAETVSKHLRGEVELSLHPDRRAFKLVNVVDLESYTHGVLSAEMPISSPLEALKAQAVVARSHALHIKTVSRRHRREGYDVCDEQHCQVYAGVAAETERSRAVVDATRGRIAAYKGKAAHVLYSSNCGGHTQSGSEISGWGDVAYWKGSPDAAPGAPAYPRSPWELRWRLRAAPPAFCMPSSHVHASHYRWVRIVRALDLAEKLNRKTRLGKILGLRTLRRSRSGHLNAVTVLGSRKDLKLTQEIRIRNLLGIGSQRSALFTVETEYGTDGKPETFIFHGGGWGHGVGLCQSGAMGRAEQGRSYEEILRAYYPSVEPASLEY